MHRRLFLAIPITPEISQSIYGYCRKLNIEHARWIPVSNWHITLQFLGNIKEEDIEDLIGSCAFTFDSSREMILPFKQISFAPPHDPRRMIWAVFESTDLYKKLVDVTVQVTKKFLEPTEKSTKDLIPHVTLARFSQPAYEQQLPNQPIVSHLRVQEIILMESKLNHNGSIYTPLHSFAFLKE